MLSGLLNALFNGVSTGSVLLLAALGLAVVFGLMGVINMAHGEFIMLGAYTTLVVQNGFKRLGEPWAEFYLLVALVAAFFVTALLGLVLERGVIRYLYGRPLETLLATWGVSLILQQFVRSVSWQLVLIVAGFCLVFLGSLAMATRWSGWQRWRFWAFLGLLSLSSAIALGLGNLVGQVYKLAATKPWFGAQNQDVTAPAWLRGGVRLGQAWGNLQLPYTRLFIISLTVLCLVGLYLFLQRTTWGLRIRAVTQNREMSACLGIPAQTVDALTFAIGSGLAGVAGCAVSLLASVGPNTGQNYVIDTFMVVVVGGVGKLVGSIVAAIAIGTANYAIGANLIGPLFASIPALEAVFKFFATTSMAKVMVFALIVAFLQVRPAGLFPQKGRSVDA